MLPHSDVLEASLQKLGEDGRYRVFIALERNVGTFPIAVWRHRTAAAGRSLSGAATMTLGWDTAPRS